MHTNDLFFMVVLFLIALTRSLLMKINSANTSAKTCTATLSIYSFAGCIIAYPFFGHLLHEAMPALLANPIAIVISMLKGVVLWSIFTIRQVINKQSTSSVAFIAPISLGIIAIANSFLGESLTTVQYISIAVLSILGVTFVTKGHLSTLDKKYKYMFLCCTLLCALPAISDQAVIATSNWYTHVCLTSLGMFISFIVAGFNKQDLIHNLKTNKLLNFSGVVTSVSEFAIILIIMNYLPVTIGIVSMQMATPTIMIISAFRWKEGTFKQQAAFGLLGFIAAFPMLGLI